MEKSIVSVGIIEQEASCTCQTCGKVLSQGRYAVGVIYKQGATETKYAFGVNPHPMCCGQAQEIIAFFDSETEADAKAAAVQSLLDAKKHLGAAGFLPVLLEFHKIPVASLRLQKPKP